MYYCFLKARAAREFSVVKPFHLFGPTDWKGFNIPAISMIGLG
jgi:hypothetical protein